MNIAEVAALCFSSRAAVRSGLKKHGIPIKPQEQLLKSKQQLRFGEMRKKRAIVANQRELAAIEKMKQHRDQGYSYCKIGDEDFDGEVIGVGRKPQSFKKLDRRCRHSKESVYSQNSDQM